MKYREKTSDAEEQSEGRKTKEKRVREGNDRIFYDSSNGRNISRAKLCRRPLPARIDAQRSDAA